MDRPVLSSSTVRCNLKEHMWMTWKRVNGRVTTIQEHCSKPLPTRKERLLRKSHTEPFYLSFLSVVFDLCMLIGYCFLWMLLYHPGDKSLIINHIVIRMLLFGFRKQQRWVQPVLSTKNLPRLKFFGWQPVCCRIFSTGNFTNKKSFHSFAPRIRKWNRKHE